MPEITSGAFPVSCWSTRYTAAAPSVTSLNSATANCAVGCANWIWLRIEAGIRATFAMLPPMLPVVSARNTMSGLGGMGGVSTVLVMVTDAPGSSASA